MAETTKDTLVLAVLLAFGHLQEGHILRVSVVFRGRKAREMVMPSIQLCSSSNQVRIYKKKKEIYSQISC